MSHSWPLLLMRRILVVIRASVTISSLSLHIGINWESLCKESKKKSTDKPRFQLGDEFLLTLSLQLDWCVALTRFRLSALPRRVARGEFHGGDCHACISGLASDGVCADVCKG